MIEIVEAQVFSKQLKDTIVGKTIKEIIVQQTKHKFAWTRGEFEELVNKRIMDCKPNTGQIEVYIENDYRLLLTDGCNIRFYDDLLNVPKKHQLLIIFTDHTAIVISVRMYGIIFTFKAGESTNDYYLRHQSALSILNDAYDLETFKAFFHNQLPKLSVKALLATDQRIPGIGNGVLQDILYEARIHPKQKIELLSNEEVETLFWAIKNVLADMIYKGGRDTESDIFGNPGGYTTKLSSKTFDMPCTNCGSMFVKQAYLGGNIYFCPVCQQLK